MILDALFLTKEQLEERKALEAKKKLQEEEAKLKKEEEDVKIFYDKVKEYKNITLLTSDFEPFFVWGIKKSEKKFYVFSQMICQATVQK